MHPARRSGDLGGLPPLAAGTGKVVVPTMVAGANVGLWLAVAPLGIMLVATEVLLGAVVVLTALYAPDEYSARAFRLLTWTSSPDSMPRGTRTKRRREARDEMRGNPDVRGVPAARPRDSGG